MNFDWTEYLLLAAWLEKIGLEQKPIFPCLPEALFRSAVSRAYYAAFKRASGFANKRDYDPPYGEGSHKELQKYYARHKSVNKIYGKVSVNLQRLRLLRVEADYEDELKKPPAAMAKQAIGTATIILRSLDNLATQEKQ